MNEGRCLCASVRWKLLAVPYAIYNCHCRMCQKVHGAAFGNYCFVKPSEIEWLSDTKTIVRYASSEVMVRSSCDICGSVVPYADRSDDFWVVPGGGATTKCANLTVIFSSLIILRGTVLVVICLLVMVIPKNLISMNLIYMEWGSHPLIVPGLQCEIAACAVISHFK
ncbi:MAG: hypothetical protein GKR95_08215 [Gammaproteobacteria bacterium]|nr:hypothetical protein [Gammaproteobacteria bacterium]